MIAYFDKDLNNEEMFNENSSIQNYTPRNEYTQEIIYNFSLKPNLKKLLCDFNEQ